MDKLNSFQEIQNTVSAIKEANRGFITNFFPEINKINTWIKKEELYIKVIEDTAFYFKKKAMFTHLFFSTTPVLCGC